MATNYQCPWCQHSSDASSISCPACGAPVDVRKAVTKSGWSELPAIKDMTKIQFGQSFCQIEGKYVPVADFKLAAGDGVYFAHHLLLWKDPQIQITRMSLGGVWKRIFAGMPLVMTQAHGPGRLAFSKDKPVELIALPLSPGQSVDVCEHIFMVATHSIAYSWFNSGIWFCTGSGKDQETHYPVGMFMDRFSAAATPGLLLLHGGGNVFVRRLAPGQTILVKPSALVFKDPTVTMNMYIEHPGGAWRTGRTIWAQRCLWIRLHGPGRVAVQSHYEHWEDPDKPVQSMPTGARVKDW